MAYLYDDMYHKTGAIKYISTSIGIVRIPSFYYGLRNLSSGALFPWFNVNMFIFLSVNVMVAYVSLIAATIFLGIKKCRKLICVPAFGRSFSLIERFYLLFVFLTFLAISWNILFGKNFGVLSAHIKILVVNVFPLFVLLYRPFNPLEKTG